MTKNSIAIIIPTYLRPELLGNCIESVFKGSLLPSKLIISHRIDDFETIYKIENIAIEHKNNLVKIISCPINNPGYIPPIVEALKLINEEITVILDDDTTVLTNWLEELVSPFEQQEVGVVGGRVVTPSSKTPILRGKPGCISWYGKLWGNVGALENPNWIEVDTIMEGNSAWRTNVLKNIKIDDIFYNDVSPLYGLFLTLSFKRRNYKIIYNSNAFIWHFAGKRDESVKRSLSRRMVAQRNYLYIASKFFPPKTLILYLLWSIFIGDKDTVGIISFIYLLIFEPKNAFIKLYYTLKSKLLFIRYQLSQV